MPEQTVVAFSSCLTSPIETEGCVIVSQDAVYDSSDVIYNVRGEAYSQVQRGYMESHLQEQLGVDIQGLNLYRAASYLDYVRKAEEQISQGNYGMALPHIACAAAQLEDSSLNNDLTRSVIIRTFNAITTPDLEAAEAVVNASQEGDPSCETIGNVLESVIVSRLEYGVLRMFAPRGLIDEGQMQRIDAARRSIVEIGLRVVTAEVGRCLEGVCEDADGNMDFREAVLYGLYSDLDQLSIIARELDISFDEETINGLVQKLREEISPSLLRHYNENQEEINRIMGSM